MGIGRGDRMLPKWDICDKIMQRNKHSVLRKCSHSWTEGMKLLLPLIGKYYVVKFISLDAIGLGAVSSFEFTVFKIESLFDDLLLKRILCNQVLASLEVVILAYLGTYAPFSELMRKHTVKAVLALLFKTYS